MCNLEELYYALSQNEIKMLFFYRYPTNLSQKHLKDHCNLFFREIPNNCTMIVLNRPVLLQFWLGAGVSLSTKKCLPSKRINGAIKNLNLFHYFYAICYHFYLQLSRDYHTRCNLHRHDAPMFCHAQTIDWLS